MRTRYSINDRYNRGWMISPSYNWPQGRIALSDRMIALVIISLRDSANGNTVTRRLLAATYGGIAGGSGMERRLLQQTSIPLPTDLSASFRAALDALAKSPTVDPIPPVDYDVNIADQIGEAFSLQKGQYVVANMKMTAVFKKVGNECFPYCIYFLCL